MRWAASVGSLGKASRRANGLAVFLIVLGLLVKVMWGSPHVLLLAGIVVAFGFAAGVTGICLERIGRRRSAWALLTVGSEALLAIGLAGYLTVVIVRVMMRVPR